MDKFSVEFELNAPDTDRTLWGKTSRPLPIALMFTFLYLILGGFYLYFLQPTLVPLIESYFHLSLGGNQVIILFFALSALILFSLLWSYLGRLAGDTDRLQDLNKSLKRQLALGTAELAQTSDKYQRLLLNISNEFVFIRIDCNHRISFISPSITRLLGYHPAELIDQAYTMLLTDSSIKKFDLDRLFSGRCTDAPYELEFASKPPNRPRTLEIKDTPIVDSRGQTIAIEQIATDVSEKKDLERALRKTQQQLAKEIQSHNEEIERLDGSLKTLSAEFTQLEQTQQNVSHLNKLLIGTAARFIDARPGQAGELIHDALTEICKLCGTRGVIFAGQPYLEKILVNGNNHALADLHLDHATAAWHREALASGEPVIADDLAALPGQAAGTAQALTDLGIRALASIPICSEPGEYLGYLELYKEQAGTWPDAEIAQFKRLSQMIGTVLLRDAIERQNEAMALRNRQLVDAQKSFIVCWTPDTRITYINEPYASFLGKPAAELLGAEYTPTIHHDDVPKVERIFGELAARRGGNTHEYRVLTEGGETRWQRWTHSAVFDDSGNIAEFLSVGSDITKERAQHEQLRADLQKFQRTFQHYPEPAVLVNDDNVVVEINQTYARRFGFAAGDAAGKTVDRLGIALDPAPAPNDHGKTQPVQVADKKGIVRNFLASSRRVKIDHGHLTLLTFAPQPVETSRAAPAENTQLEQNQALPDVIRFAGWRMDTSTGHLIRRDGKQIALSATELRLLKFFAQHPKTVLSKEQLFSYCCEDPNEIYNRSVIQQIAKLRKIVEENPRHPAVIKTERGAGYYLAVDISNGREGEDAASAVPPALDA